MEEQGTLGHLLGVELPPARGAEVTVDHDERPAALPSLDTVNVDEA